MKFMLLVVGGDPGLPQPSEARLRPNGEAKTVKLGSDGKRVIVDGPFTETKEAVGGYYLGDFVSEAEAIEWARRFPPFFHIEVRQVWEM